MPQEIQYHLGYYFFAPQGRFEPCGMFTSDHIIASLISIAIVLTLLLINKKRVLVLNKQRTLRVCAVLLTALEIIKISHSFIYGDYYLDAWFPLSYCGLFIFALWMAGYGKKRIKRIGEVFIAYGCPFAGVAFLIFPTTSLMIFPVWHYFSIYSLFFHSLMIYIGLTLLFDEEIFNTNSFLNYLFFVFIFAIPAITLNCIYGCNLMNLREPYNIPIQSLQNIYMSHNFLYTVLVLFLYSLIPLIVGFVTRKIRIRQ